MCQLFDKSFYWNEKTSVNVFFFKSRLKLRYACPIINKFVWDKSISIHLLFLKLFWAQCEVFAHLPRPSLSDSLLILLPTSLGAQCYDVVLRLSKDPWSFPPSLSTAFQHVPWNSKTLFLRAMSSNSFHLSLRTLILLFSPDGWEHKALTSIFRIQVS